VPGVSPVTVVAVRADVRPVQRGQTGRAVTTKPVIVEPLSEGADHERSTSPTPGVATGPGLAMSFVEAWRPITDTVSEP
jgi:hypothetical protein